MTPEERDRLIVLETEFKQHKKTQDDILKIVTALDQKSNRITGGIVVLAAVGGVIYWILQTIFRAALWN
jgi:magnesium-transporting ATPase (P-type)